VSAGAKRRERDECGRREYLVCPDIELGVVMGARDGRIGQLALFGERALLVCARVVKRVVDPADVGDRNANASHVRGHDGTWRDLARLEYRHKSGGDACPPRRCRRRPLRSVLERFQELDEIRLLAVRQMEGKQPVVVVHDCQQIRRAAIMKIGRVLP
jgi:hypothetical protein